jgi:RNA polymerase sigma-70 factor (ECF subfamily)
VGREEIEAQIRQCCTVGDYRAAATVILQAYGAEISSLLCARLHSEANGSEVFGMFCEDLWRALPGFEFRCSSRTWAYVLARHAELRFRSEPQRRPDRNLPFAGQLADMPAQRRSSTSPYRQTQVRERLRALRQRLHEQDELLLLLRVDRALSWREIARVLLAEASVDASYCADTPHPEPLLEREAARLRQRFQVIKQKLRHWAEEEGLLPRTGAGSQELATASERAVAERPVPSATVSLE